MSDETDLTKRHEARQLIVDACAKWIDQWDYTAGSIVTGYVVIMETVRPNGTVDCTWATGTAADVRESDTGGLPSWRVEGMARKVVRDIHTGDTLSD